MAGGYAVHGWSYYLRAFNLVRDKPVVEIGWGQWSKPSQPKYAARRSGLRALRAQASRAPCAQANAVSYTHLTLPTKA